jgi:hypothetical protein
MIGCFVDRFVAWLARDAGHEAHLAFIISFWKRPVVTAHDLMSGFLTVRKGIKEPLIKSSAVAI